MWEGSSWEEWGNVTGEKLQECSSLNVGVVLMSKTNDPCLPTAFVRTEAVALCN